MATLGSVASGLGRPCMQCALARLGMSSVLECSCRDLCIWLQVPGCCKDQPSTTAGGLAPYTALLYSSSSRGSLGPAPIHGMSMVAADDRSSAAGGGMWQGHQGAAVVPGRRGDLSGGGVAASYGRAGHTALHGWAGSNLPGTRTPAAAAATRQQKTATVAVATSRCQWQQQQWQQGAYGELLHHPQQVAEQHITGGDVARLKQLVPAMQPPCVSELAASTRPFPSALLTASSVAAASRDAVKGLKLLVSEPQNMQQLGSPKWVVGPGGRVEPYATPGIPDKSLPSSGRR